jgi:transcriptional regulator with XRE-family HTH domain
MFDNLTLKTVKNHIADLVKTLRTRKSLTQEELAEQLGMSRLTIQNLEAGKNPTIDTVLKVLQYFDMLEGFDKYIISETENNSHESLY